MQGRRLSAEEASLWARVIATVEPLAGRGAAEPSLTPALPSSPAKAGAQIAAKPQNGPRPSPGNSKANTLDGSWDRKLTRGTVQPDIAVDLHGHTLDSAYRALDAGLDRAIAQGARVLLLVTGKPREPGSGRGAIRAAVGDWLAASRHADEIAAVRGAHPRHGGSGALYIILKRARK
ncbi:Smr/MutS family protein [Sphingomonas sp.]|uniref:Smr/MutS family protein n=1 Tax=Sphingomonas sp. TaxID=28214 RepID=UPI002DE76C49|nr:Smr/MutS family protein [Sphingomonas sp.]